LISLLIPNARPTETPATAPTPATTVNFRFSASLKNVWVSGADGGASDSKGCGVSECKSGASESTGIGASESKCDDEGASESTGITSESTGIGASESECDDESEGASESTGITSESTGIGASESACGDEFHHRLNASVNASVTKKSLCHRYEESNSSDPPSE
jgi:hypothetical protein